MKEKKLWLDLERTVFFQEKIGVTPSVVDQDDTNPSDATDLYTFIN